MANQSTITILTIVVGRTQYLLSNLQKKKTALTERFSFIDTQ